MDHYFKDFENRSPPPPLNSNVSVHSLAQILLIIAIVTGAWYLHWRWTASLNFDAIWFSIPLVVAESGAFIGLLLFIFNVWKIEDTKKKPPPVFIGDCDLTSPIKKPISVDIFFPTFDEDVDLVQLSIEDAKKIQYPHSIDIRIHILDDGNREKMVELSTAMGCNYITRTNNIGFKAGNMRNAIEQTSGDFILICDADTRPFPTILEHTLGYFRDIDVAWVQTPQWFFDLPEGNTLSELAKSKIGTKTAKLAHQLEKLIGPIRIGDDPFVNDPKMFYDVIQRRRNWANASFCCGAGSIHRREAVMQSAIREFSRNTVSEKKKRLDKFKSLTDENQTVQPIADFINHQTILSNEFTPYKFHVSEDIYTSIELHSDKYRHWKSVMHPEVESKMLSPQDLLTWTVQRFKYAGGTLDIAKNDDFLFRSGLSVAQKLMYLSTIWSYFGGVWNLIFLLSPIIYLLLAIAPVSAYSIDFYKHIVPFLLSTELGMMFALWGLSGLKSRNNYIAFFPVNLKALWTVLRGRSIKFPVTSKSRQEGPFLTLVWPQFSILFLTLGAIAIAWSLHLSQLGQYSLAGLVINTFWGLNNSFAMSGMIFAALWKPDRSNTEKANIDQSPDQEVGIAA